MKLQTRLHSIFKPDDALYANFALGVQGAGGVAQLSQVGGPHFTASEGAVDSVPGDSSTTAAIAIGGTQTGIVNTSTDSDWYRVDLVAGQSYLFTLTGNGATPLPDPYLHLHSPFGPVIALDDDAGPNHSSLLRFTATTSGTYYLEASSFPDLGTTGGYALTANIGPPQNPLDTIDWGFALSSTNLLVYFATAGQTFDGVTAIRSWTNSEITAAFTAFSTWSAVVPVTFALAPNPSIASFVMTLANLDPGVLGQFHHGPLINSFGVFAPNGDGWNTAGLKPGGNGFITLMHEIGHGLGLKHPHDNGPGGHEIMEGVLDQFDSLGTHRLNQGAFTTMSYNDGYVDAIGNPVFGLQATPGPLDIALAQQKYGARTNASVGDDSYVLLDTPGNPFRAIWDTGGSDTISYAGNVGVTIDLRAATLLNADGGGGYVSRASWGGFTIANGVVIENGVGGAGGDIIFGNDANNMLTGDAGNDRIDAGAGDDTLLGGLGDDTLTGGDGADTITGGDGDDTMTGGAGADSMIGGIGQDTYVVDALDTYTELPGQGTDVVQEGFATFTLPDNFEVLVLLPGASQGFGNAADDQLIGNDSDNYLDGGLGNDTMSGGLGDDTFIISENGDRAIDDGGYDVAMVSAVNALISANVEETRMIGAAVQVSVDGVGQKIFGNSNNNLILGGTSVEAHGDDGNDQISAPFGANHLFGDAGDDTLHSGDGNDVLEGGAGADSLFGSLSATSTDSDAASYASAAAGVVADLANVAANSGDAAGDTYFSIENITGSTFDDTLTGDDAHANVLKGGDGADVLSGRAGDDTLDGGVGADLLNGGDGFDVAFYANASAGISLDIHNLAASTGEAAGDTFSFIENVVGTAFNDTISWDDTNNLLNGGAGADVLSGGGGNDTLDGGAGADVLDGGDGFDAASYANAAGGIALDIHNLVASTGEAVGDTFSSVENVLGSAFNDAISWDDTNNILNGGGGDDTLLGNGGGDWLIGGVGNDVLNGGAGADLMDGGGGFDAASYANASAGIALDIRNLAASTGEAAGDTFSSVELVLGTSFNDTIAWDDAVNILNGAGGDDNVSGNGGGDWLIGGIGNDILSGGAGADFLDGGDGFDAASYANASVGISLDIRNLAASTGEAAGDSFSSIENVLGTSFNDTLSWDDNFNILNGGAGDDTLSGNGAGDWLIGGIGNDVLNGGAGADLLDGGDGFDAASYATASAGISLDIRNLAASTGEAAGDAFTLIENVLGSAFNDTIAWDDANNILNGGAGNDTLSGKGGSDWLIGGTGNDTLDGGAGVDLLAGGAGNDKFVIRAGEAGDAVSDFNVAVSDVIDLIGFGAAFDTFNEVRAHGLQHGADAVFDFGGGQTLTLANVSLASMSAADFIFG